MNTSIRFRPHPWFALDMAAIPICAGTAAVLGLGWLARSQGWSLAGWVPTRSALVVELAGLVAVWAGALGVGLLRWVCVAYVVGLEGVARSRGVIQREHVHIPASRIQDIARVQPVLPRVLGLSNILVASASEQVLALRHVERAERLERLLRRLAQRSDRHGA